MGEPYRNGSSISVGKDSPKTRTACAFWKGVALMEVKPLAVKRNQPKNGPSISFEKICQHLPQKWGY
jgi:hypothetical protein